MALNNAEVLGNLKSQLKEVSGQLNQLTETRLKLLGAIDVLEQIEESNRIKGEILEMENQMWNY